MTNDTAPKALARLPWAWLCLLAPLPLVLHSVGAPLGEPVADDYDFLHHAIFQPGDWMDGGGAQIYWRPLARQVWYALAAPAMLEHPAAVALIQALMMSLAALLLYRALRVHWDAPRAAFAALFPFLMESARQLLATPTNVQDLGAILFVAVALHEASRRRMPTALLGLAASLLCKEMAVIAAPLLAWLAPAREGRERFRWTVGALAVVAVWGALYSTAVQRAGLLFARDQVATGAALTTPWPVRYLWSIGQSAGDALSLSGLSAFEQRLAMLSAVALISIGAIVYARRADARLRLQNQWPWVVGGLVWFLGVTATLADVYPEWRSYRSTFGLIGLGAAMGVVLGSAHPSLLASLAVLKLVTFAASPGPPPSVGVLAEARPAAITYPELVRVQRFVSLTRHELLQAHPVVAPGQRISRHLVPRLAMYGFAGDRALQVWYRDSTVRWQSFGEFLEDTTTLPVTIVQYQQYAPRQVVLVNPAAMRSLQRGADRITHHAWEAARIELARAESLQVDRDAQAFFGILADRRALALAALGHEAQAEREARRAVQLRPESVDARYVLARLWARAGQFGAATHQLDTLLALSPSDSGAARLRRQILAVAAEAR